MKRSIEGSIYQSKDKKSWFARLRYTDADGRPREKKRVCATHAKAKSTLKDLRAEVDNEKSDRKTFRQLDAFYRKKYLHAARFIDGKKISGFRQDLYGVTQYLDFALAHFGDRFIDTITYADLQHYRELVIKHPTRFNEQRSYSSINHFMKTLRRVLNVAVEQEWLVTNPFKKGEPLIRLSFEPERTRVLSPAEETRLLDKCIGKRRHLAPVIIFAIETGCRKNEILSLKWQNVILDGRFIQVESHNTKTLKGRFVPISARLGMILRDLWRNSPQKPNIPVFMCGDFKKSFVGACVDAGLRDITFHDLRHTAITRMLEKNISPALVMKISGHTQSKTFMRYVNQSESSILEIARRLDMAA
jgi:integrase